MTWLWALVIALIIVAIALVAAYFLNARKLNNRGVYVPRQRGEYVDLDQDSIPLNDGDDATSLMFHLSMEHGAVFVNEELGRTRVEIGSRSWYGRTALDALQKADRELNGA